MSFPRLYILIFMGMSTIALFAGGQKEASSQKAIVLIEKPNEALHGALLRKGAEARAKELGYKLQYEKLSPESDENSQVNLFAEISASHPAGILLAAAYAQAYALPIETAMKSGIPIIIIDSSTDSAAALANITIDNFNSAFQLGCALAGRLGGKGKVVTIAMSTDSNADRERKNGFLASMRDFPGLVVLPMELSAGDDKSTLDALSTMIRIHPDISAVFSTSTQIATSAAHALGVNGLDKKVMIFTFDLSPEILSLYTQGTVQVIAAADTYQMGYLGVSMLAAVIKGNPLPTDRRDIMIPALVINHNNFESPEIQDLVQSQ